ncbi:MAG: hypothetical protein AAGD11_01210 [Planctomycetota bacterium]
MTNENNQPDWNLLPADPRGFFSLSAEFERKELKRAYNRLIRIYKPEKHPNEFQRIRAAFEELDMQLRYGYSMPAPSQRSAEYQWEEIVDQRAANEPQHSAETSLPRLPIHERIEAESPQAIYQELAEKSDKDPYEYFALAILADVADRKDPLQFARWLLEGLRVYPSEHGLLHLMRDYLREVDPSPVLSKLLIACSQAVPTDNFYPLTEPAWENLLREADFSACIATLKQCQSNLGGIAIGGQLIFMLRMLRFALWRDKSDWKDQAIDFIEENYEQIPPHMELELEILAAAHRYVGVREEFLNGDALRERIDHAMQSYFTLDQVEGDQAVLQCQLSLLDNTGSLLDEFPADGSDECQTMYTLWDWISTDVADRYGVEQPEEVNTNLWLGRCSALLKQCRAHTKGSAGGWRWQLVMLAYLCVKGSLYFLIPTLLCFVLVIGMLGMISDSAEGPLAIVLLTLSIGAGLYGAWKMSKWLERRFWIPYCMREAKSNYHHLWRREVLDFLDRSQLNFHLATQLMAHASTEDDVDSWVSHFMQQDFALAIFATARRFLV